MKETLKIEELNTFLPLTSLEALPAEDQKIRLQYWKEHFTNKEITTGLGTYNSKLYDLYKKHDITSQGTTNSKQKERALKRGRLLSHSFLTPLNQSKRKHFHQQSQCKTYQ
ncbi:hypothetical protein [Bacillus sp. CDB3]|uniref:hypothetical protein n=1 Tax=Bacillus sp. CDB3 TaxID=360310 RepID=UPI0021178A1D|nr:hypothetical protein [Bacillus sp. CDB3]